MSASRGMVFWWRQIWHDEALRSMPIWIVVTALNTSVATGVLVFTARSQSTEVSSKPNRSPRSTGSAARRMAPPSLERPSPAAARYRPADSHSK